MVFGIFVLGGISDWLDGWLARRLNQTSDLGRMLDPIADRLYILVSVVVLLVQGLIPTLIVALILLRDVFMAFVISKRRRAGFAPPQVHYVGKAATMLLLYSIPLVFLASAFGGSLSFAMWLGNAFLMWGVVVYWYAAWLYFNELRTLTHD
jgi:cardiolipin synthase